MSSICGIESCDSEEKLRISYNIFEDQDSYDPLLYIYPFPILIQLKYFIDSIKKLCYSCW